MQVCIKNKAIKVKVGNRKDNESLAEELHIALTLITEHNHMRVMEALLGAINKEAEGHEKLRPHINKLADLVGLIR